MKFDLAALASRATNRRSKTVTLRPIEPTQALASDLYGACYRPIIEALTNALPAVLAAYERGLSIGPVRDAADKPVEIPVRINDAASDDAHAVISGIGDLLNRLALSLAPGLRTWANRVERWHRGKWRGAVLTASKVDIDTLLQASGTPTSLQETINWNTSLIKDVGAQAQSRISSAVFAGFTARKPVAELAKDLREVVAMSRRRSLLIASDQTTKLSAALDRERATDAGFEEYVWRHSFKQHPRRIHVDRNGEVFRYDDPPADGPPGSLPYCGCRAQARLVV